MPETKSVRAVDQTPSRRPHDVIIIKMEARSGSGLRNPSNTLVDSVLEVVIDTVILTICQKGNCVTFSHSCMTCGLISRIHIQIHTIKALIL